MPEIVLRGIPIDFPFEPYDVQRVYMEKVIECLQQGSNGVLESPTGTGKTLCLLCASLGWLRVKKAELQAQAVARHSILGAQRPDVMAGLGISSGMAGVEGTAFALCAPKIIYASRTHTQLSQALSELKRTNYAQTVRCSIIGSRDQLCINGNVLKEEGNANKIHACQRYVAARSCLFYNNVETHKDRPPFNTIGILDIEDLVREGKKQSCCPYYMAREIKNNADIIFMPYNYLLDPKARKANNIELENSIVILDEAHNIEKVCEESASLQFRSTDIALCIDEVTKVMKDLEAHTESSSFTVEGLSASVKDFGLEDLIHVKTLFLELEKAVDQVAVSAEGSTYPGSFMFELLAKVDVVPNKRQILQEFVDKMAQYLTTSAASAFNKQGAGLQRFSELLTVVFNQDNRVLNHSVKNCYKVHVTLEDPKNKKARSDNWLTKHTDSKGRVINYWCFSPSFGMQLLSQQGARCILLTSGTLSPIPALVSELGIKVPVTLENGHVVDGDQVFISVVSSGPDGTSLNSSYNTRNDPKYIAALGRTIQNFSRVVPGGLLIFFPSYPVLKKCQDEWQSMGIWPRIAEQKAIFVESQSKEVFSNNMADYYDRIHNGDGKGACFLAVCRGKVSEGLDFSDNNGRAVIITGLPYPPLKDPRVMLKQKYLDDSKQKDPNAVSGQLWYQLEASRAVNQAIGRVIRHRHDFGAILLCDTRFNNPSFKQQLSAWLQPHIQSSSNFGTAYKGVTDFFKKVETILPQNATRNLSRRAEPRSTDVNSTSTQIRPTVSGFSQARSRMVAKPAAPPSSLSTSQISRDILNSSGSPSSFSPSPLVVKNAGVKRKNNEDLFSALNNAGPSQVISFHEKVQVDMMLPQFSRGKDAGNSQPANSRRKLVLSQNQPSSKSVELPRPSASKLDSVPSLKKVPEQTKTEVAAYWAEVKKQLSSAEYKEFMRVVKSYTTNSNLQDLLMCLKKLFLEDHKLVHLFKEFARFVKTADRSEFHAICDCLS